MMRIWTLLLTMGLMAGTATACAHGERRARNTDRDAISQETELRQDSPRPATRRASDTKPPLETLTEEELHNALDRALAAAIAASVGDSPCERSYNSMVAMRDSLVEDLGEEAAQDLPERQAFVEACEQLPRDAQRCMDLRFAMDNHEECQRIMEEVPTDRRRALEELLGGE